MIRKKLVTIALSCTILCQAGTVFAAEASAYDLIQKSLSRKWFKKDVTVIIDVNADIDGVVRTAKERLTDTYKLQGSYSFSLQADEEIAEFKKDISKEMPSEGIDKHLTETVYFANAENGYMDVYTNDPEDIQQESAWTYEIRPTFFTKERTRVSTLDIWDDFVVKNTEGDVWLSGTLSCRNLSDLVEIIFYPDYRDDIFNGSDIKMAQALLGDKTAKVDMYLDKETYVIKKMHIDLKDADMSDIAEVVAIYAADGEMFDTPQATIQNNALEATLLFDFSDPVSITIPEEALLEKTVFVYPEETFFVDTETETGNSTEAASE